MDVNKISDITPPKTAESIAAAKADRQILLKGPNLDKDTSSSTDIEAKEPEAMHKRELKVESPAEQLAKESQTSPEVSDRPSDFVAIKKAELTNEAESELNPNSSLEENKISDYKPLTDNNEDLSEKPLVQTNEPIIASDNEEKPAESNREPGETNGKDELAPELADENQEAIKTTSNIDSILPDSSQIATTAAKDIMQSPNMHDTKVYYVPISNSQHKHGHAKETVIAGIVTAVVVIVVLVIIAKFI